MFLPGARVLAAQLSELIARFDEAEAGALARVQAAEQEAAAAVADAVAARAAADAAEQGRRSALAQARQDRQARDNAVKEADRARSEAEQIRTSAWEQVAGHERSRGQAEAARSAAQASADALIGQNRHLREQVEQAGVQIAELSARLAGSRQEQERVDGKNQALTARIEAVERLRAEDAERLRARAAALQTRAADLQAELAATGSTLQARSEQVTQLQAERAELGELRAHVVAVRGELAVERSAHELDRHRLGEARQALAAAARRRKLRATEAVRAVRP